MMVDEESYSAVLVFDCTAFCAVRVFLVQPFVDRLPIVSAKNNSFFDKSELSDVCSFTFSRFFSLFGLLPVYPIHSLLQSGKTRCHGQLTVIPCFWIPFVLVILTHDNSRPRSFSLNSYLNARSTSILFFLFVLFVVCLFFIGFNSVRLPTYA